MNWFRKYYENRRRFVWRYRYVKCPRCGVRHWLKAVRVVD